MNVCASFIGFFLIDYRDRYRKNRLGKSIGFQAKPAIILLLYLKIPASATPAPRMERRAGGHQAAIQRFFNALLVIFCTYPAAKSGALAVSGNPHTGQIRRLQRQRVASLINLFDRQRGNCICASYRI